MVSFHSLKKNWALTQKRCKQKHVVSFWFRPRAIFWWATQFSIFKHKQKRRCLRESQDKKEISPFPRVQGKDAFLNWILVSFAIWKQFQTLISLFFWRILLWILLSFRSILTCFPCFQYSFCHFVIWNGQNWSQNRAKIELNLSETWSKLEGKLNKN